MSGTKCLRGGGEIQYTALLTKKNWQEKKKLKPKEMNYVQNYLQKPAYRKKTQHSDTIKKW